MHLPILIALTEEGTAHWWATRLQKVSYVPTVCYTNVADALDHATRNQPALLLTEAAFDHNKGFILARQTMQAYPTLRCAVSVPTDVTFWQEALEADVSGYLPAPLTDEAELLHCLSEITQRRRYISPALHRLTLLPATDLLDRVRTLKPYYRRVLKLTALGKTARQTAIAMRLKKSTIRTYREDLVKLLSLKSAAELKGVGGSVLGWLD